MGEADISPLNTQGRGLHFKVRGINDQENEISDKKNVLNGEKKIIYQTKSSSECLQFPLVIIKEFIASNALNKYLLM